MNTELQKYNDFKKRHNLAYEDIVKIVTEYANTGEDCARTYFSEKYNITPAVFYKARDFAVTCHLVDVHTCKLLMNKAAKNCASHNEKSSSAGSRVHFEDLWKKRKEFLCSSFSNEEITDICNKYVEGILFDNISKSYEICIESVKRVLKIAIEGAIIPSYLVTEIKNIVKSEAGEEARKSILKMEKVRKENIKKRVEPLMKEAEVLNYQIENYDSYFRGDNNIPSKVFLINRLSEVQKKYQKILEF